MTSDILHLPQALLLELGVADGQHLIDDQDFGIEIRRDRECQPYVHAAAEALDRSVEKFLDAREIDDLVELLFDLPPRHAEDAAVEKDVLAAGELGMEPGADFQQAGNTPANLDLAGRRPGDPRQDLQQCALAGSVAADDADHLARTDVKIHVLDGPEHLMILPTIAEGVPEPVDDRFPEVRRSFRVV